MEQDYLTNLYTKNELLESINTRDKVINELMHEIEHKNKFIEKLQLEHTHYYTFNDKYVAKIIVPVGFTGKSVKIINDRGYQTIVELKKVRDYYIEYLDGRNKDLINFIDSRIDYLEDYGGEELCPNVN